MSLHAHAPRVPNLAAPPTEKRRCVAMVNPFAGTVEANEHTPRQCRMGASPWLPEFDYCATHIPAAYLPLTHARAETWNALVRDVWAQVLAEHPLPEDT